jgi:tetratricopeptide (TPR) repeat protein
MRRSVRLAAAACLAFAMLVLLAAASPDGEIARLERARDADPADYELRDELGLAYYQRARAAWDRAAYADYERDLGLAMNEWIESLRLEPRSPEPHTMMGIVAAYQGDLDRALRSFANARKLAPRSWTAYTNIAQIMVYRGHRDIEKYQELAGRYGANMAIVELNYCLLRWREGDVAAAERGFRDALRLDPEVFDVWDVAPVPVPIRSFADMQRYCCANPACGPYMADACKASELDVQERELPEETVRKELLVEMERRRALQKIYQERKELEIEVEPEEPAPSAAPTP